MDAEILLFPTQTEDDGLETLMQRRLGSRVRGLRVLRLPAGLIIQGRAATYHAKQLATHAAMALPSDIAIAPDGFPHPVYRACCAVAIPIPEAVS